MEKENYQNIRIVDMDQEPIELYKILKFDSLVSIGGKQNILLPKVWEGYGIKA